MKKLIVIGAGGHGRSAAEIIHKNNEFSLVGFVDDAWPDLKEVWGIPVLGGLVDINIYRSIADAVFVAIGNNSLRASILNRCIEAGFELPNIIHSRAIVSPSAVLGRGVAVMAGAVVGTEASLGDGAIVNAGAVVDHHAVVSRCGHLGVNAAMAGGAMLGNLAWIQAGVALGYGAKVADGSILKQALPTIEDRKFDV